jgi:hypothetical protein
MQRDDITISGDALHALDDVFDLSVATRALTRAARRDPTADGAAQNRGREMSDRESARLKFFFERDPHVPGFDIQKWNFGMEPPPRGHSLEIDNDRFALRKNRTANPTPCTVRNDRNPMMFRRSNDTNDLIGASRPHDSRGFMGCDVAGPNAHVMARPQIACVHHAINEQIARDKTFQSQRFEHVQGLHISTCRLKPKQGFARP